MAAGTGKAVQNGASPTPQSRRARLPRGPERASLTFITGERPQMPLLPALAAHGVGLPHFPPHLPPRHAVSGPAIQPPGFGPWHMGPGLGSWGSLKDPEIQAPYPSPVGAADAPSSAQGQVGLIHSLAVGLVVTERDNHRLLGADPLAASMKEKVG